jgi:putative protease
MHNKTKRTQKSMELLAPAGSFPAFEAALEAGADAVYVGAPGFNARALSRDFTFAEIGSMIRQAHQQGVKLYIAMNSLVKEAELPAALEALSCFEELQPNALIIQDLGLLYLARTWFPGLPLHASTLMSVHNSLTAAELTHLGCTRVVLARELTLDEIGAIHQKTEAELEVFVHGAMCFSYSGLCLFSSLHGGKSSLRGQCVQPCRRRYAWQQAGKKGRGRGAGRKGGAAGRKAGKGNRRGSADSGYFFSMNDLCGLDMLPALRRAGVACLKIEGRLKSAQYVAKTVSAYRMALDCFDKPDAVQQEILQKAHILLDEAMGRKRSGGYLLSAQPGEAITPEQSGTSGRLLGRIKGIQQNRTRDGKNRVTLQLTLAAQVSEGDRLRLHDETGGSRLSFTLRSLQVGGRRQKTARAGERVSLSLFVDRDEQLHRRFRGSLYKVDVGGRVTAEQSGRKRQKKLSARKVLPDRKKVAEILARLAWQKSTVDSRPSGGKSRPGTVSKEPSWWVAVSGIADLRQRLPVRPARFLLPLNRENMERLDRQAGKIKKYQARMIWYLPPVIHETDLPWFGQQVRRLTEAGYSRFVLGHCCQYGLFSDPLSQLPESEEYGHRRIRLYGNYTLNLLNSAAVQAAARLGFQGTLFSLETERENLTAALRQDRQQGGGKKMRIGVYAYGHPALFTARLYSRHFRSNQLVVSPKNELFTLEHRHGLTAARAVQPFSLLQYRQELAAMGVDFLLLDLTGGPVSREAATVGLFLARKETPHSGAGREPALLQGNFDGLLV